jgi:hypothetical protein
VSSEAAGPYQLRVSNPFGTVDSRVAAVVVDIAPEFTRHPVSTNIPAGATLILSAELTGTEPLRLTWTLNGLPVLILHKDRLNYQLSIALKGNYPFISRRLRHLLRSNRHSQQQQNCSKAFHH